MQSRPDIPFIDRLSNLNKGDIYKYSELCTILNEPVKHSCSKEAQLKVWASYMLLEKVGRKLKVNDIYITRTVPIVKNSRADTEHVNNSQSLLLDYFVTNTDRFIPDSRFPDQYYAGFTALDLADICGYLPKEYKEIRRQLREGKLPGLPESKELGALLDNEITSQAQNLIRTTLNRLKKYHILYFETIYIGVKEGNQTKLTLAEATKYTEILRQYTETKYNGVRTRLTSDDYKEINAEVREHLGVSRVYSGYSIGFTLSAVRKELEKDLHNRNLRILRGRVHSTMQRKIEVSSQQFDGIDEEGYTHTLSDNELYKKRAFAYLEPDELDMLFDGIFLERMIEED
jgi:hypothetical protein